MEPTSISTDMLKTAEGQNNAVFACAGSALQHAQEYEQALKFFIRTLARTEPGSDPSEGVETFAANLQRKTLGRLLVQFGKKVKISDPRILLLLETAVEKRNFLAHHFFLERINLLADEEGRFSMMRELTEMQALFKEAGTLMRAMGTVLEEVLDGTRTESKGPAVFTLEIKT